MINSLKILNGNLELAFNKYIYYYTVKVDSDIVSLIFDYKLDDDWKINIRNNTLNYGNNLVYVDVYNDIESKTYTFSVYKEMTEEVNGIDNYKKSLEINNVSHLELYKVQLLGVGLFLTIVLLFTVLFKRRKISKDIITTNNN